MSTAAAAISFSIASPSVPVVYGSTDRSAAARLDLFLAEASLDPVIDDGPLLRTVYFHALEDTLVVTTDCQVPGLDRSFAPDRNPQSTRSHDSHLADNGPFEPAEICKADSDHGVQTVVTRYLERGFVAGELAVAHCQAPNY